MKLILQIKLLVLGISLLSGQVSVAQTNWPSFQNGGQTISDTVKLPLKWTPESVLWTTKLAGYGQSSPVVHENSVYVCSVTGPNKDTLNVESFSVDTGAQQWTYDLPNSSPEKNTVMVSRAASTPVVDHDGLVAFFGGGNICALDHQGKLRWKRDLKQEFGPFKARHGLAASLEQSQTHVFLWAERSESPFVMALNKATGKTAWKVAGLGKSGWSSPRLVSVGDQKHLVLSGSGLIAGFNPVTGERLWEFDDVAGNTSATPVPLPDGRFLIGSNGGRGSAKTTPSCGVIQIENDTDKFAAQWLWKAPKASCTFGSPLAFKGRAYFVNRTGIVHCHDLKSGKSVFVDRLPGGPIWATPLANNDAVYFFGKNGTTSVIATGTDFKLLAKNVLWAKDSATNDGEIKKDDESEKAPGPATTTAVLYAAVSADSKLLLRRGNVLYAVE